MNDVWQQIAAYLQSDQGRAQFGGAADALAQQGGWSTMPSGGVAQNIATALAGARQGRREQEALDYAKSRDATQDRFKEIGLYLDQQRLNQGLSAPSSVREWEYFNSLSPEDQKRYLSMKRTQKTVDLGGSVAGLDPMTNLPAYQMQKTLPPQSQPENIRAAEDARAASQADAAAEAKRVSSQDTLDLLSEAEKLLPGATDTIFGSAANRVAGAFGKTTTGASANSQLGVIAGQLVGKMPRFEGPQSDKDVQLYKEMAGDLANEYLPAERRLAALKTIRALNQKAAGVKPSTPNNDPLGLR